MKVFHNDEAEKYLAKRSLENRFQKAVGYIESGYPNIVDLKLLRPKDKGIWQFRITKKYRALAFKQDGNLFVFQISDHQ